MVYSSHGAKMLLCIDSTAGFEWDGRLYHPSFTAPVTFHGICPLLFAIEQLMNEIKFPLPDVTLRTFHKQATAQQLQEQPLKESACRMNDDIFKEELGEKGTFIVQVQFRQNATWQGVLSWTEEKKTMPFRSALELLTLMNDALEHGTLPPHAQDDPA